MGVRSLLFDLDGTLTNSDPYHFEAFAEVARRYGVEIDAATFLRSVSGQTNATIGRTLFPHLEPALFETVADEKEALFRRLIKGRLRPIEGLLDLLDVARRRGWSLALVSNAPRANIVDMLTALRFDDIFAEIVVGGELPLGKPHPLPYLTALARLGAESRCAAAFEDARPGLQSAHAAGVATIGLTTTLSAAEAMAAGADLAIADYRAAELAPFLAQALDDPDAFAARPPNDSNRAISLTPAPAGRETKE